MCVVKWDRQFSNVCRGTKQGSILSPTLFNVFINDLLKLLAESNVGVRVDSDIFNSFAYADDISVLSLNTTDLQILINICFTYSKTWKFNFGITKTKCMISGVNPFIDTPVWKLGGDAIENVDTIEILGTVFSKDLSCKSHVEKRTLSCRRSVCALASVGCSYPGLSSDVKAHLWRTIGLPSLTYGIETLHISVTHKKRIESTQASIIKSTLGFPSRCHHSSLLNAMSIDNVYSHIKRGTLSLWRRIFDIESPARRICEKQLRDFLRYGHIIPGTILDRVCRFGISPIKYAFTNYQRNPPRSQDVSDGVADSLKFLIMHDNFIKPYSDEHILARLLITAF